MESFRLIENNASHGFLCVINKIILYFEVLQLEEKVNVIVFSIKCIYLSIASKYVLIKEKINLNAYLKKPNCKFK